MIGSLELTKPVSMVTAYLSCQGVVASCLGGASPSVLPDPVQEASPLEDPSGAACQGVDPSYLQQEEPCKNQSAEGRMSTESDQSGGDCAL